MDGLSKVKSIKIQEVPVEAKEPTKKELEDSIQRVNQSLKVVNTDLQISLDKEINDKVVRVVNTQSGEVIRQFPSKEFLEWEREYARLLGLLFDKKV
jgi:flagellar protein FlaG